jgi:hypothetical protein
LTFFTEASGRPTVAARTFARQLGWTGSPGALYQERCAEDRHALERVGAEVLHVGFVDALFRLRSSPSPTWSRVLPAELWHRYPTYRWHVAKGRVSRGDDDLRRAVAAVIRTHLALAEPTLVLAPLGTGSHVDHLIVRDAAAVVAQSSSASTTFAYYSDAPYALRRPSDEAFARRHALVPESFHEAVHEKSALVKSYRTQVDALYPGGVPQLADELWWPVGVSPSTVLASLGAGLPPGPMGSSREAASAPCRSGDDVALPLCQ